MLGDVIEVKSFLSVLKKVLTGQDVEKLTLSSLQPLSSKQVEFKLVLRQDVEKLNPSSLQPLSSKQVEFKLVL